MRWSDLTRSILFPLAVPGLLCLLWFAGWAEAFDAATQGMSSLPAIQPSEVEHFSEKAVGPMTVSRSDAPESPLAVGQ